MRRTFIIVIIIICTAAFAARAEYTGPSERVVVKIERPMDFRSASEVLLEGRITRHLEKDWYVFTNDDGSVIVKITPDKLAEFDVSENDIVRIHAEIHRPLLRRPRLGALSVEVIE